ncbi:uncharacterized protein K02A2.6-like [Copidosoma floridanum]|uniref:uncharacterized protein K02A2.6-like n=1 Tax=Copidosoma floridanum TaxID=29053 RepID=UPI0006C9B04D|nr:uncharacterized protein K02A2.6-like [Copidosoma floridanum]
MPGLSNVVADALSRVEVIRLPLELELPELAKEQQQDSELSELLKSPAHSLNLRPIELGHSHTSLYCDLTGKIIRSFIPKYLRKRIFDLTHSASHPGTKVTDQLIRQKYVWPNMHRDIATWCKGCLNCQQSKISRHVKNEPLQFIAPDDRFRHVHMDLVGPLNTSQGYSYILTMINRFSRWVEAVPLKDISTASVLRAFQESWIARFGAPRFLTTDQGSQFESQLFQAYFSFLGCQRIRTVAYHPAANGMIEQWHRSFKVAVMCHNNADWVKLLPTVLLGLRTAVRSDTGASPADFLYGTKIRVPGELFLPSDFTADPQIFIEDYREHMKKLRPVPVTHRYKPRAFFFKDLYTCSHVFLRTAAVRKPLERPYTGPYKVLERISDQDCKIDYRGTPRVVSTELLKPAHFVPNDLVTPALTKSHQKVQVSTHPIPILKTYSNKKKVTFDTSVK